MSILIKGMEMPTSCDMCWALDDYGDYPRCRITEEQRGYNFPVREQRMGNCPLVPVPSHGRLVDMGEIEERIDSCCDDIDCSKTMCNECAVQIVMNKVFDAPTIIPAEEGET